MRVVVSCFSPLEFVGVVVLAAGLWASAQYGGNYKEVGADGKGDLGAGVGTRVR